MLALALIVQLINTVVEVPDTLKSGEDIRLFSDLDQLSSPPKSAVCVLRATLAITEWAGRDET
jgi:hypothetical protein